MNDLYTMIALLVAVWGLSLYVRAPSIVLFTSVLSGQILASQAGNQVYSWTEPYVKINEPRFLLLALYLVPAILTLIILRRKVSKNRLPIEAIPYLFISALAIVLAVDYSWVLQQKALLLQNQFGDYKAFIVLVATLTTLVNSWINFPSNGKHKKKHSN